MPTILVIDDDRDLRETLKEALERAGYLVGAAADGRAGLKLLREHPVDLVITDIFMPEMDGIETILTMRALRPGLQIIAMSGGGSFDGLEFLQAAHQLGAFCAIPKPFDFRSLLGVVQAALEKPAPVRRAGTTTDASGASKGPAGAAAP